MPGVAWPAIPGEAAAVQLALQFQLERSQWLAPEQLRQRQFVQLDGLLRHAYGTVPFYRERWRGVYDPGGTITPESLAQLPVVTRGELQANFEALKSATVPAAHGEVTETRTSGSTGRPVRVLKTALIEALWRAFVLREHGWHRRDLSGKLAAIRHNVPEGESAGWGPATDIVAATGSSAVLSLRHDTEAQLDWLERQQPDYLLSYPSNLAALARRVLARGNRLSRLREIRTIGEVLDAEVRALCRQAWQVPITDAYSSQEAGYLALQCPAAEHYHVQSEGALVEILNDAGGDCAPGDTGRVVVTDLHNYATPLVRYEIGDYAEVGEPCRCGRGLPVLRRVAGRTRNMLVLANGSRYWPTFGSRSLARIAPILQHQFVQKSYDVIEARLVTSAPLTVQEEETLRAHVASRLPAPFEIRLAYVPGIARSAGGKFEDFISEIA